MSDATAATQEARLPWQGIHHVALFTRDLDATIRFYRDALEMELLFEAPAGALHGRHCAIRPDNTPQHLGLHFFEHPDAPLYGPLERTLETSFFNPGSTFLSHLSFALPDEQAGQRLRERLEHHHIPVTPIMKQGSIWNMGFLDNNGLALEAAWPREEGTP